MQSYSIAILGRIFDDGRADSVTLFWYNLAAGADGGQAQLQAAMVVGLVRQTADGIDWSSLRAAELAEAVDLVPRPALDACGACLEQTLRPRAPYRGANPDQRRSLLHRNLEVRSHAHRKAERGAGAVHSPAHLVPQLPQRPEVRPPRLPGQPRAAAPPSALPAARFRRRRPAPRASSHRRGLRPPWQLHPPGSPARRHR